VIGTANLKCGYLPVAAVAAAAPAASSTPTAATMSASPTPTPSASVTSVAPASAAPTTAFPLRASFVDNQSTAEEVLPVQRSDGFFGFRVVTDFSETKASRLPCKTIAKQSQGIWLHSDFGKQCSYLFFRCLERQIAHVQFLHGRSPYAHLHASEHALRG
jgi:hypothetical protein